jgi:hypothetical protein
MSTDPDAIEIGNLYRKASPKRGSVTPLRNIFGKLSGSRNATPNPYAGRSIDATRCHWCEAPFQRGQMRYPMLDDTTAGWALVSVCIDCFKGDNYSRSSDPSPSPRQEHVCPGCGEPIFVSPHLRWYLKYCSLRCYQREYRKRKRSSGSTIAWKGDKPPQCAACKKSIGGKRRDSRFCSNKCRQWHYRRGGQ